MTATKALSSISDAVVNTIMPVRRRALSPGEIDSQLRALREEARARHKRATEPLKYRRRWARLSEDEVVDEVERRVRRRIVPRAPSLDHDGHRPTTR